MDKGRNRRLPGQHILVFSPGKVAVADPGIWGLSRRQLVPVLFSCRPGRPSRWVFLPFPLRSLTLGSVWTASGMAKRTERKRNGFLGSGAAKQLGTAEIRESQGW